MTMLAKVIFTPNSVQEQGGVEYTDIKVQLENGKEVNIYAKKGSALWDALYELHKGQIVEVTSYEKNGNTHWRLSDIEISCTRVGRLHPANYDGSEDFVEELGDTYVRMDNYLTDRESELNTDLTEETVRGLASTAFIQAQRS